MSAGAGAAAATAATVAASAAVATTETATGGAGTLAAGGTPSPAKRRPSSRRISVLGRRFSVVVQDKLVEEDAKESEAYKQAVDLSVGPDLERPTTLKAIEYNIAKGKARDSEIKLLEAHTNSRIVDEDVESAVLHKFEFLQKLRKSTTAVSWKAIDKKTVRFRRAKARQLLDA